MRRTVLAAASLLLAATPLGAAFAQANQSPFVRDRNVTVRERPRPDFDAAGIHAGAFFIFPRVGVDVAYEDNIFATERNEESDWILAVRPGLEVISQWSRHQVRLLANSSIYRYQDFSRENNEVYSVEGSGRLDILRNSFLRGVVGYEHLVEPRSSASVPLAAAKPIEYDRVHATVGARHEINRLRVSGEVRVSDSTYEDSRDILGALIDQSYRDHENLDASVRVDYALSPALAVTGTLARNSREYADATRPGDVDRDSEGWEAVAGVDFDVTALARGQVQVGYISQEFDDPRAEDVSGFGLRTNVDYFPTQLTTVSLTAERAIDDTGLLGAAGSLATRVSLQVDHELRRNVLLTARVNWQRDDFRGVDRKDDHTGALLGVNYLMSRKVGLNASYRYTERTSKGALAGDDFTDNRFQIGAVLQY